MSFCIVESLAGWQTKMVTEGRKLITIIFEGQENVFSFEEYVGLLSDLNISKVTNVVLCPPARASILGPVSLTLIIGYDGTRCL